MGDTHGTTVDETEVGSYFVANYPPFSVWTPDAVERDALPALSLPAAPVPLGLYLHVPFCRKRCHFCYFRVYTDKNAQEVDRYTFRGPGQATSYFYGYTRLLELRAAVENALGPKFDQKAFHDAILAQGLLPPTLMREAIMKHFGVR